MRIEELKGDAVILPFVIDQAVGGLAVVYGEIQEL